VWASLQERDEMMQRLEAWHGGLDVPDDGELDEEEDGDVDGGEETTW
jgi:hypothetical protein